MTSQVKIGSSLRLANLFAICYLLSAIQNVPMIVHPLPFGVLLRRWRERRRMTQTDLALAAESSTRHLSCLETGRAQPSREMIAKLAENLNIPLRDRNTLLLAAGFAPAFRERTVTELEAAKSAIDRVLQAHLPYPAFAVDRHCKENHGGAELGLGSFGTAISR